MRTRDCSFYVQYAVGSEKMLSESHSDAASEWWRRRYANDRISWRSSCWLLRGVSRGTAYDTRIALVRTVINASVSRVPTKCTTKDAAALFAARLSTCCCVCTNLTYASTCVWKWHYKEVGLTTNIIWHLNIMSINDYCLGSRMPHLKYRPVYICKIKRTKMRMHMTLHPYIILANNVNFTS